VVVEVVAALMKTLDLVLAALEEAAQVEIEQMLQEMVSLILVVAEVEEKLVVVMEDQE